MATKSAAAVKVNPLADRVVVKPLEESEQMRGGLYIPDTAKEKPQEGEVIAAGPGRFEKDKRVPMEVKVGDKVLYGKYSGTEVTLNGDQYLILRESDILAIVG
ncbi:MAG TPA: co-chaperone GroES [Gemmatimonadaceae bacterium]|nr:co-chaperone GroES [Gemmatimonadaceae bacterium]